MSYLPLVVAALLVGTSVTAFTDFKCAGPTFANLPANQFCCDGVVYYDNNFSYACCPDRRTGRAQVCSVSNNQNTNVRSSVPNPVVYRPAPAPAPAPAPQPQTFQQPNPMFNPFQFNSFMNYWQQMANMMPAATTTPTAPHTVYCDGVDLSQLQRLRPSLQCCANTVIYDSRYYRCGTSSNNPINNGGFQIITTTTRAPASIHLPTAFSPLVCKQTLFYIDPRIANNYKCCDDNVYDQRTEKCQQAYRRVYQPINEYRVVNIDPNVRPQRATLTCGSTRYIFENQATASSYNC